MESRHVVGSVSFLLASLLTLPSTGAAKMGAEQPTNCCAAIYRVGSELGRLQSIANHPTESLEQDAALHLERLSDGLESANRTCCRFCEAWSEWRQMQDGARAAAAALRDAQQSEAPAARRSFRDWAADRHSRLLEGLNRCDLDDGMPCKWLDLVGCARDYFRVGVQLGRAMHWLSVDGEVAGAAETAVSRSRPHGLESLGRAVGLLAALRGVDRSPGAAGEEMRCEYLWSAETDVERLLSEVVEQPAAYTDLQLAARSAEAHRLVLRLLVEGDPELGISPCPIGGAHDHAECEFAEEHGHLPPAG